MMGFETELT